MTALRGEPGPGFRFRRLEKPEEFRSAEELQRAALGEDAALAVPASVLRTLQDTGGLVLGAFADIYLAGVAVASLGWDGATLYQHAHGLAIRSEYQNHRVGRRLAAYLRDEVLALGVAEVRGSFDPLSSRAAYVGVHALGAVPTSYRVNVFGRRGEEGSADPETDRLLWRWPLAAPEVLRRFEDGPPTSTELQGRWERSRPLIETDAGESGLRLPTAVVEAEGGPAHLEIPFDLDSLRTHEARSVRRWRHAVRDAFRLALDAGLVVDDYAVLSVDHERRGFYLLRPGSPAAAAAPAARP